MKRKNKSVASPVKALKSSTGSNVLRPFTAMSKARSAYSIPVQKTTKPNFHVSCSNNRAPGPESFFASFHRSSKDGLRETTLLLAMIQSDDSRADTGRGARKAANELERHAKALVNGVQGRNLESGKVKALAEHINADDNFVPPIFDGFDHRMPARRTAVNKDRGKVAVQKGNRSSQKVFPPLQ